MSRGLFEIGQHAFRVPTARTFEGELGQSRRLMIPASRSGIFERDRRRSRDYFSILHHSKTRDTGDLRWFDASLEGGADSVYLSRRQMNGDRLDPPLVRRLN
jgi:hypothetical protein